MLWGVINIIGPKSLLHLEILILDQPSRQPSYVFQSSLCLRKYNDSTGQHFGANTTYATVVIIQCNQTLDILWGLKAFFNRRKVFSDIFPNKQLLKKLYPRFIVGLNFSIIRTVNYSVSKYPKYWYADQNKILCRFIF